MADILLKGGKMLNKSCPNCNAPLFKHQGRTFCPRCNWEEGKGTLPGKSKEEEGPAMPPSPEEGKTPAQADLDEPWRTLGRAEAVVLEKIRAYSDRLSTSDENVTFEANIDALDDLLGLLDKILEMKRKKV